MGPQRAHSSRKAARRDLPAANTAAWGMMISKHVDEDNNNSDGDWYKQQASISLDRGTIRLS